MATKKNTEATRFTGLFGLIAVLVAAFNVMISSCSNLDGEMWASADTVEIVTPPIEKVDTLIDTVIIDNSLKTQVDVVNRIDTIDITTTIEKPSTGEKDIVPGKVFIYAQKTGYEIFENKLILTPAFANAGRTGGRTVRENLTTEGWTDVTRWFFPTEDDNVIVVEARMGHLKNKPYVRVSDSEILSLLERSTRSTYKVRNAPIHVEDRVSFDIISAGNDSTFTEDISTDFDRDLMAEDDVQRAEIISKGWRGIDPTTVRDSLSIRFFMKSGATNDMVVYRLRKNEFTAIDPREQETTDFSGYRSLGYKGLTLSEAENTIFEDEEWTQWEKKEKISFAEAGEKPFDFFYYAKTQRSQYHNEKWNLSASFDYIKPEFKEVATPLNIVDSDRAGKDKAVINQEVSVKYAGFETKLSEVMNLYKEAKKDPEVIESGFEKKGRDWSPSLMDDHVVHYKLYDDGTRTTTIHEAPFERLLGNSPEFERVCKDNTNRTGRPSIVNFKSVPKTYTDKNGGHWTCDEETGDIQYYVELNGADGVTLSHPFKEHNNVRLEVDGDICEWGEDGYVYTVNASVAKSSVKGDYEVTPYTAKLNYVFGDAPAKESTNTGKILVKESRFFDFATVQYAVATTTMTQDWLDWLYCISIHLYNEETGKYYVLPVMIEQNAPHTMKWDFSLLEECDKKSYDKYNSVFCRNHKKWLNAFAEDTKVWMQWSSAEEGTQKTGYGTMLYDTARSMDWDYPSFVDDHATVNTKRYKCEVKDGRLFITDTYDNVKLTDKHCVNGGWK